MHIDQNGRVGIGTDNPDRIFHITTASPIIKLTDSDNSLSAEINGSSGNIYFDTHNSNRDIIFRGSTTEVARVTGDGKVGIGTDNPYYNLEVNFNNSDTALSGGSSGNWGGAGLRLENENNTVGSMSLVHFRTGNHADWHIGGKFVGSNTSDFVFIHESSERLRIDSSGRVGINTTTHPDTASALSIMNGAAASEHTILDIRCDNNETSRIYFSEESTSGNGSIRYVYTGDENYMSFYTSGTSSTNERFRIENNGQLWLYANAGDNQLNSKRIGSAGSNGDYFFNLTGRNNNDDVMGSLGFHRDTATDDGRFSLSTRTTGGSNTERLRVDSLGSLRTMSKSGYWQITAIHDGSGSGNWHNGSAAQRIYPNYIDNNTGYAEFYMTFHPSTSYTGYGEPTLVIRGGNYLQTTGEIAISYNGRTNSPNSGVFRALHAQYQWMIYNDGDTDAYSGMRSIDRYTQNKTSAFVDDTTHSIDYIASNDGRYGTNSEPILDQKSYIKIKLNGASGNNAIQGHTVFCKFTCYTNGDKTWAAYMYYG